MRLAIIFLAGRRRDSKASAAASGEHAGRRERGQAERGVAATSERLTESLRLYT